MAGAILARGRAEAADGAAGCGGCVLTKMPKKTLRFAIILTLLATLAALRAYTAPADCTDGEGHGPDPGTAECNASIAASNARRPLAAGIVFLTVLTVGIGGAAIWVGARKVARSDWI
ncbi:hypothetical protein GCM10011614_15830 [Novosphingobium colocasiae]|uniref:Uncharacterized protein n=1 Tax=Novosphingobium colocasiae TaxID=1256513 RepID=A0A918PEX5_9SPHN|nr:hypothetical protein GCM10011614_15830 [Novosphingobium colocasiae]